MRINSILSIFKAQLLQKKVFKTSKEQVLDVRDSVKISQKGRTLQKNKAEFLAAKQMLGKVPNVRQEKVQSAVLKIKNDFYNSPAFKEELSKKLIESSLFSTQVYNTRITSKSKALLRDVPDVRESKIKSIRERIKDNFYSRKETISALSERILRDLGL